MLEPEAGAVSGGGYEGQGGRGFAGKEPGGSGLVGLLFILEAGRGEGSRGQCCDETQLLNSLWHLCS